MGQSRLAHLFLIVGLACWPGDSFAGQAYNPFTGRLDLCDTVQEVDGSPSNAGCGTLTVTNGSLTDNGNGTFALAVLSTSDAVLTDSSPSLEFRDTSDNTAYLIHVDTAAVFPFTIFRGTDTGPAFNVSPSTPVIAFDSNNKVYIPDLKSCGSITSDANGRLNCSAGASGSGTVTNVATGTGLTGGPITTSGTLSLVTPVTTANGGTNQTAWTANQLVTTSSATQLAGLGAATNGQVPIGSTGAAPVLATLTGVASETDVTNGAGTITVGIVDPLIVGKGGSGVATFTTNGVLYGNAAGSILVTAQGPTNSVLTASAGAPSFSASPTLTGVSVTNNVQWLPATGTQFEAYASGSQWFLTDLTNGNVILRVDNSDRIFTTQTVDLSGATLKGIVPDRELVWPASSMLPLEFSADAIPPITKNTGTNVDNLSVDYDDTALECREVTFQIPQNVDTNGLVTFRLVWYPATAVANNVVWDIRHVMRATGQTWDAALTTYTFPASTASASANVVTIMTQQVPMGTLGWTTSSNYVICELCRNGGNAGDTLVGDAKVIQFGISIPRLR